MIFSNPVFELFHCLQGVLEREDTSYTTETGTESRPNTGHSQSSKTKQNGQVDRDTRNGYENEEEKEGDVQVREMSEENSSSGCVDIRAERENSEYEDDRSDENGIKSPLSAYDRNPALDEPSDRETTTREEITEAVASGIHATPLSFPAERTTHPS